MSEIWIPCLIVLTLILLNGFFVAAEFALIGTPRPTIETEAENGDTLAARVLRLIVEPKRQDRFIATAQLGITLASLGLGMYGEQTLADWLGRRFDEMGWHVGAWLAAHTLASAVAVTALTYFHIVLGEMVPKSLALQNPQRMIKGILPAMEVFEAMVFPLVLALNGSGNFLLRMLGIRRQDSRENYRTTEELTHIVDESENEGKLDRESASILRELLEFGDLTAGEVMVPRTQIVGIPNDCSGQELKEILRTRPHTRYLIFEDDLDKILGFVHVKDLLRYVHSESGLPPEVIRPVPFVPASSPLETVLKAMRKAHSQLTVVMDEHGGTAGMITVEDLFEEVVGEISEDAREKSEIHRDPDGRVHALGIVRLIDLGDELGVDLEHEDVDTVSGLVLASIERPAQVGDKAVFKGVEFEVIAVKGRGVRECLVRVIPDPADPTIEGD